MMTRATGKRRTTDRRAARRFKAQLVAWIAWGGNDVAAFACGAR